MKRWGQQSPGIQKNLFCVKTSVLVSNIIRCCKLTLKIFSKKRHILKPVKRLNICDRIFCENSLRFSLFSQKDPSEMFDRVLTHSFVKIMRLLQKQLAEVFIKKAVLKNCATLTGKHLCWSISLIWLQYFRSATLLKRDSNTGVFRWILQNFKKHLFWRKRTNCFFFP